jgi:hypothetical protein
MMGKELSIGWKGVWIMEFKRGVVVHEGDQARFDVLFTIKGPPFFQEVFIRIMKR